MADVLYKISPDGLSNIKFQYTALPTAGTKNASIRLLTLFPGVGGDPVHCSLISHMWHPQTGFIQPTAGLELSASSQEPPRSIAYEALSYAWGDTSHFYRIDINDQTFPVTRTVLQALFYLRKETHARTLWIDAISINQGDIADKGIQIRQMHRIYQHAHQVIIWLGISTQNSDLAFEFIDELYSCFSHVTTRGSEGELQGNMGSSQALVAQVSHLMVAGKAREWLALHLLFKRGYWARAWIFQELLMAREIIVVCGTKTTKWGSVDTAMRIVQHTSNRICDLINSSGPIKDQQTLSPTSDQNPHYWSRNYNSWLLGLFEGRYFMKHRHYEASPSQTVERWLSLIQTRLCKYQHDKIYSILGIVSESVAKLISDPDYCQPAQIVFKQAARAFMLRTGSLNILCFSHHTDTQDDLPFWTFDWRRAKRMHFFHDIAWGIGTESQRAWHSSVLSQRPAQFSEDLSVLSVHGIVLGAVRYTDLESKTFPCLQKLSKIEPDVDAYNNRTCHHSSHTMVRWQFDKDTEEILPIVLSPSSYIVLEDAISTLLYMVLMRRDPSRLRNSAPKSKSPDFMQDLAHGNIGIVSCFQVMTKCRTVIETDTLELALTPFWTQPGDIICQFIGCTAPVVLRQQEGNNYKFIGDCYVFGKMGKAMIDILKEVLKKPDKLERFNLM